jgi:hypothetical protein
MKEKKFCVIQLLQSNLCTSSNKTHYFSLFRGQNFSLTKLKGLPKSLLPVCGKPLISHWIEIAESVPEIDEIVVVTNNHFYGLFSQWKSNLRSCKKGYVFLSLLKFEGTQKPYLNFILE